MFGNKGNVTSKDWKQEALREEEEILETDINSRLPEYPPAPTNWTSVRYENGGHMSAPEDWEKDLPEEPDEDVIREETENDDYDEMRGVEPHVGYEPDGKGRTYGSQKRREDFKHKRRWKWLSAILKDKKVDASDGAKPIRGKQKNMAKKNKAK